VFQDPKTKASWWQGKVRELQRKFIGPKSSAQPENRFAKVWHLAFLQLAPPLTIPIYLAANMARTLLQLVKLEHLPW
jgi:hypothetical protein